MLKKRVLAISYLMLLCLMMNGSALGGEWRIDLQGDANHGGVYSQTDPVDMTEPGIFWNIFEVPALDAAYPGPASFAEGPTSLPLFDIDGSDSGVAFTIISDAWGWAGDAGQESQPMAGDYLLVLETFGVDCEPTNWQITGLASNSECTLTFDNAAHGNAGRICYFEANGVTAQTSGAAAETTATITVTVDETGTVSGTVSRGTSGEGNWSGLTIVGTPAPKDTATTPLPKNGQTDVLFDADLEWISGINAVTHDVYLGTDIEAVSNADRSNPMGVLASEGQTTNAFDPGNLTFDQTYYWRVDEVSGAPDFSIAKGDIWSFTIEPRARTVEGVTATSNAASVPGQEPERIIDGSGLDGDQHSNNTEHMWTGTPNADEPTYLQFEFDKVYKLYEMLVWNYNIQFESFLGYGLRDVTLEYSQDGIEWTVLGDAELTQATGQPTYTANTAVSLQGVAAQYLRMTINNNFSGENSIFGLSEVRFSYIPVAPTQPQPTDGDVDVAIDTLLSWRHGREAVSHDVYLGTDPNVLTLVDTTTESLYEPTLDLGTTHYWQIVEVNDAAAVPTWAGDVWSFSTQEYLVVDDFERYVDDVTAGDVIWEVWTDGWVEEGGDPDNGGAIVGNASSPFAEQDIVHSGNQSMPMFFDNASASAISEVDLSLTPAQDWTVNGIQSLSLWFYGAPGNTGTLYVKINNTKVTYNGDATDIAIAQWQPWNIDLAAVGGDLSNVTTVSVGVEGTGSGKILIDDIRLYGKTPQYVTPVQPDSTGLVAHYALDGNANDSSGNGYNGTETGGYLYVDAIDGQGLDVDGASGYVDITNATDWPAGYAPRTMAAWLKTDSVDSGYRAAVSYGLASAGQAMFIAINGTTVYGGGYADDVSQSSFWVVDEWFHTALTYDGTTARLYGNGLEIASGQKSWDLVLDRAHIGQQINDYGEFWDGTIDEVYIYNEALSAEEVAGLAGKTAPVNVAF